VSDDDGQFKMKESTAEMDGKLEIYAEAPSQEACQEMFNELRKESGDEE
jgi:acylphosphatase